MMKLLADDVGQILVTGGALMIGGDLGPWVACGPQI